MNGEKILIVIPTYNEASIIEKLILEIKIILEKQIFWSLMRILMMKLLKK